MTTMKGGCLCGNIRYELLTEPRATYACHCRFCQKDTGTAHRSGLSYLDESVIFSGDTPKTYTYQSDEHGKSSTNIFAQLAAPQSHLQLKDFQVVES